jgi:flagellar assembly protein FliH
VAVVVKNTSKVITAEEARKMQRWQAPTMGASSAGAQPKSALTAAQLEKIQQQAYEEGLQKGLAAGASEVNQRVARLDKIMSLLQAPMDQLDDEVEQELVTLALTIARQIIRRELATDPSHVMAVVRETVSKLPLASHTVHLHLHPEDAALVREALAVGDDQQQWHIVEDPAVTRGGCRVVTDTSQIDATLEKRLTAIAAQMLGGQREGEA